MNLATIEAGLIAWVKTYSGLTVAVFENMPRPFTPGAIGILSWVSSVAPGVDETRWEVDDLVAAPDPNATPIQTGPRVLALQIAVETIRQSASAPHSRAYLETLRTRHRRDASLAALKALNVASAGLGSITQVDYMADGRMVSRALCEMRLNAAAFDRDNAGATSTIETAEVTSHVDGVDGVELPPPLNYTDKVMP